jgi:hypothetical protein
MKELNDDELMGRLKAGQGDARCDSVDAFTVGVTVTFGANKVNDRQGRLWM